MTAGGIKIETLRVPQDRCDVIWVQAGDPDELANLEESFCFPTRLYNAHRNRRRAFLLGRFGLSHILKRSLTDLEQSKSVLDWFDSDARVSFSHTQDCAVVAKTKQASVGIDIELQSRVIRPGIEERIMSRDEGERLGKCEVLAVFCAKEAIFKARFAKYRKPFGFKDVEIISLSEDGFSYRMADGANESSFGFFLKKSGYIIALTLISHQVSSGGRVMM